MRRDEEGVASVIGTIMALLIFLTFMSMFVNTYIPIWMKENERLHMNEAQSQMGEVKGKIDNLIVNTLNTLIVNKQVTGASSINTYEPITMGADGIPLFASATAGAIILRPVGTSSTSANVQFNYTSNNQRIPINEMGGGKLEFYAPNRYYVGQWLAYENGALIVKQDVGEAMKASPSLEITKSGNSFNVIFTQIDIYGTNSTMVGTGVAGVNINLIYLDMQTYTPHWGSDANQNSTVYKFNTVYNGSLMNFLKTTLKAADPLANLSLPVKIGSTTTFTFKNGVTNEAILSDTLLADKSHMVTLQVINTGTLTLSRASVQVEISV
ncbi:MAG TPA: hypothetical protein VGK23_08370 [Methanomassiliicoccales archaeon]|jgi:hypothetical protein